MKKSPRIGVHGVAMIEIEIDSGRPVYRLPMIVEPTDAASAWPEPLVAVTIDHESALSALRLLLVET